jgi:hypothetical protein
MGDTLFGRERTGTPVETREGTGEMANYFRQLMQAQVGGAPVLGRTGIDAAADITSGLRTAMEPFHQRQTAQQVGDLREMFGTAGGRFGSTIAGAEGQLRGDLSAGFAREQQQAMLQALAPVLQAEQQRLATAAGFLAPGSPVFQEGIAGDLLTAGGMAAGMMFPPAGAAMAAGGQFMPGNRPTFSPPSFIPGAPGLRR